MSSLYFFTVLLFGIFFVFIASFLIFKDYKKNRIVVEQAENEKVELISIIDDAELMVNELNNFSEYVLQKIDKKNLEVDEYIEKLEQKLETVKELEQTVQELSSQAEQTEQTGPTEGVAGRTELIEGAVGQTGLIEETIGQTGLIGDKKYSINEKKKRAYLVKKKAQNNKKSPLIYLNFPERIEKHSEKNNVQIKYGKKYSQIFQFIQDGYSESEIAKKLNIGKGEVSLILGLKGAYEKS